MTELKEIKSRPFAFLKISCNRTLHTFACSHKQTHKTPQAKECNHAITPIKICTILLLCVTSLFNQTFGQATKDSTSISKNTVYLELLGNGGIYSFNYDRIILTKKLFKISGSIGISYIPPSVRYNHTFTYPAEINFLYGKRNYLELGIGYTLVFNLYKEDIFKIYDIYSYPVLRISYRLQKPNGGFFFTTGLLFYFAKNEFITDYSNYSNNKTWIGLGFGYTLKNKNQKK
jgi:hypothetical protein